NYSQDLGTILGAANADNSAYNADQTVAALVADIATGSDSTILELGTGNIYDIYATFPINGKLYVARGAAYSAYEFPSKTRLNDTQWQQMVTDAKEPSVPAWTSTFMAKSMVNTDLVQLVHALQGDITRTLWLDPKADTSTGFAYIDNQKAALKAADEYEGRQIIDTSFIALNTSADGKTATIKTRETWQGTLYKSSADGCSGTVIGQRGPYDVMVTYTLKLQTTNNYSNWIITDVTGTDAPAWKKK
ncbi:MAG TPA: DUF3160 domain-containing protein, partial [Aggregatilineales bacterium]|nr:DUF3160 domain-containing protein [Aggregatilineales bacterium]